MIRKLFFSVVLLAFLTNCSELIGRRMHAHKHQPFETTVIPVELNGIYFKVKPERCGYVCGPPCAFFLYADGTILANAFLGMSKEVEDEKFWSDPEKFVRTMTNWEHVRTRPGAYFIENGKFTMDLIDNMPSTPFNNFIRF